MGLFRNTKSVVGVFDNDADVEKAVEQLQDQGYGQNGNDEITIIDSNRLGQEMPINQGLDATIALNVGRPGYAGEESWSNFNKLQGIQDTIKSAGIGDEEARFFARQATRDGRLIIAKVAEEDAPTVEAMFENVSQAQTTVS